MSWDMSTTFDLGTAIDSSYSTLGFSVNTAAQSLASGGSGNFRFDYAFRAEPDDDHWPIGRYGVDLNGSVIENGSNFVAIGTASIISDPYNWEPDDTTLRANIGITLLGIGSNGPGVNDMRVLPATNLAISLFYGSKYMPPTLLCTYLFDTPWSRPSQPILDAGGRMKMHYNRSYFFYHTIGAR